MYPKTAGAAEHNAYPPDLSVGPQLPKLTLAGRHDAEQLVSAAVEASALKHPGWAPVERRLEQAATRGVEQETGPGKRRAKRYSNGHVLYGWQATVCPPVASWSRSSV